MRKIWFISSRKTIRGPLTTTELEQGLTSGYFSTDSMIWWKNQTHWISVATWKERLPLIRYALETDQKPDVWHFEHHGVKYGPINLDRLLEVVQTNADLYAFKVNKIGSGKWLGIYECPEVLEAMGARQRVHSRVPLTGVAAIQMPYDSKIADTATISEGGLGLVKAFLPIGHIVKFTLKSPVFPAPIRSHAEVLYTKPDGFSGLKFDQLHVESQSLIMDYIKKFSKAS
ncbi:MAG: GYF domain-containing protein [Bdellovibrionales bacterium]